VFLAGNTQRYGDWDKEGHIRVHLNIEQKQFSQPTKEITNTRPRGLRIWYSKYVYFNIHDSSSATGAFLVILAELLAEK
jgi:hypothetical protein